MSERAVFVALCLVTVAVFAWLRNPAMVVVALLNLCWPFVWERRA